MKWPKLEIRSSIPWKEKLGELSQRWIWNPDSRNLATGGRRTKSGKFLSITGWRHDLDGDTNATGMCTACNDLIILRLTDKRCAWGSTRTLGLDGSMICTALDGMQPQQSRCAYGLWNHEVQLKCPLYKSGITPPSTTQIKKYRFAWHKITLYGN